MRTFETNFSNDFVVAPDGNLSIVGGAEAIADVAKHFGYTARDEQIFDRTNGVPFWSSVFGGQASVQQFEAAIRRRLSQSPEVVRVENLVVSIQGDIMKYTADLVTPSGARIPVNG